MLERLIQISSKKSIRTTIYLGTVDGIKVRKTLRAKNQLELSEKIIQAKLDFENNNRLARLDKNTFGIWAKKWLNEYKIPMGLSSGTITQYKCAIKNINQYFENLELKDINLSNFQCMINELSIKNPSTQRPSSKGTLQGIIKVAHSIFRYASSNNVPNVPHFFKEVVIPKKAPCNKRRALTYEEQQMIIDTPHRCQLPAMIMLFSGLRRGELIPLTWSDIDLENGFISVTKSVEIQKNQSILKVGGKTGNAVRKTAIPPILIDFLKEQRKKSKSKKSLVCTNTKGQMHSKTSFCKMWESYLIDLNIKYGYENKNVSKFNPKKLPMKIERFTPHYLRHTYATLLYLQGVNMVTAKQYLGHADIQTTVNIYTDLGNNSLLSITDSYKKRLNGDYKIKVL